MEFLDKLVLPQSLEHLKLLHYLSGMVLFMFVPFMGMLIGGLWMSLYYKSKAVRSNNPIYLMYANDIIEHASLTKSAGVILGLVPVLGVIMTYTQILHTVQNSIILYFFLSLVMFIPGVIFTYTYRYSFAFASLFDNLKDSIHISEDDSKKTALEKYNTLGQKTFKMKNKAGKWGLFFLLSGLFFFSAGITLLTSQEAWGSHTGLLSVFTNIHIWVRWFLFLVLSFVVSGGYLLFIYFYWEGGIEITDPTYKTIVSKSLPKITLVFSLLLPLFIFLSVTRYSGQAYNSNVFLFLFISVSVLFAVYHFLYDMLKYEHVKTSLWVFVLVLASTFSLIVAEESALSGFSHKHAMILGQNFDLSVAELKKTTGAAGAVDPVAIFNTKCLACHAFDRKVVGPPYKETLPKYEGDVTKLVEFIKNPYKIDPAYPIMPNQGLKPQEAVAIAKYIMEEYKKK
ncbi:MAG: hypothetical protein HUU54_11525 [Ignavibacteriaceae bacterium]|nr:hypothetical protein [Ignavibacteriaceae bacterium]